MTVVSVETLEELKYTWLRRISCIFCLYLQAPMITTMSRTHYFFIWNTKVMTMMPLDMEFKAFFQLKWN